MKVDDFILDIDSLFPVAPVDDVQEEQIAREMLAEQPNFVEKIEEVKEVVPQPSEQTISVDGELPRVWRFSFDSDWTDGVDYSQTIEEVKIPSRSLPRRIEIFESAAPLFDTSPSPPEDSDDSPRSDESSPFLASEDPNTQDDEYEYREVAIDSNGQPRQAGADCAEGEFIKRFRARAEQSLFVFLKGVLGRFFLTPHFHQEICQFLQTVPPFRKLILMPREHAKTAIVSGGLPLHILIQPAKTNIYFTGMEGSECRILLAGENSTMAEKNLRVLKNIIEENKLFRAFWPHRCWMDSKPKVWSSNQIIIPRENEWPDPTIKAVGVGGAITGARPNVMIKDDLVSFKAMNSDVVMQEAIDWHVASRALLDTYEVESGMQSLEFIIGTRWQVHDLYSYIMDKDPSVAVNDEKFHRIVNNGRILWPEKHTLESIEQLQLEHGSMFYLMYLNSAADPSLTDFDCDSVRSFAVVNGKIVFAGEGRDSWLAERQGRLSNHEDAILQGQAVPMVERGMPLSLLRLQEAVREGRGGCRLRA